MMSVRITALPMHGIGDIVSHHMVAPAPPVARVLYVILMPRFNTRFDNNVMACEQKRGENNVFDPQMSVTHHIVRTFITM